MHPALLQCFCALFVAVADVAVGLVQVNVQALMSETNVVTLPETNDFASLTPPKLKNGLVYIKVPKTGGSTFGGALRRAAMRRGLENSHDGEDGANHHYCDNNFAPWIKEHFTGNGPHLFAHHRCMPKAYDQFRLVMPNAFYVTMIRAPAERCLSQFNHFEVFRQGKKPSQENKVRALEECSSALQIRWLTPEKACMEPSSKACTESMKSPDAPASVLRMYDFIGVTERFDESLVVLGSILGLDPDKDLAYLSGKVSSDTHSAELRSEVPKSDKYLCENVPSYPSLKDETEPVRNAANRRFKKSEDMALYELADKHLSRAIKSVAGFDGKLSKFKETLEKVSKKCGNYKKKCESCMWRDNGCGQVCIDSEA